MKNTKITEFRVEFVENPLGIDTQSPRFSWKLVSDKVAVKQTAYRIVVTSTDGTEVWDTGKVESDESNGTVYTGAELSPCTEYTCQLEVWDENESPLNNKATSTFETGLMNPSIDAWSGAQWIGPTKNVLSADVKRIFVIEAKLRIPEGSTKASLVFGANDPRLLDPTKNDYLISGENYIEYQIDIQANPAKLNIFRVGYYPTDVADVPFASVDIVDTDTGTSVINDSNKHDFHTVEIEVTGNCAYTRVDGKLVDVISEELKFRMPGAPADAPPMIRKSGRQLNPAGNNDVPTYPGLCEIGFAAPAGNTAHFESLIVRDYRTPNAIIFEESASKPSGIFDLKVSDGCIVVNGGTSGVRVTADPSNTSIPMLRRKFSLEKNVESARLYVTSRGIYELHINAQKYGDSWFNPGASQYDKHIMYQTYDITENLRKGENAIGFYLASGWWSDSQTFALTNYNYYGDRESLLVKMVIKYEDGTEKIVVSDPEAWKHCSSGPVTYASFFHGEHFDASRADQFDGFSSAEYDDSAWTSPDVITPVPVPLPQGQGFGRAWPSPNHTTPDIIAQVGTPVKAIRTLQALSMTEPKPGIYVYDMGQNMVGVPKVFLRGTRGSQATLRYGEVLYPNLEEYGALGGMILTENLRDATNVDKYIFKGDSAGEEYMPRFTFHGYRFIEISGVSQAPALEDVKGVVLSSIVDLTGNVETSDPLLNRFFENIRWSQFGNFVSIPTDCPQRNERMGWAADAQVFARTATYNADVRLFLTRYLQMIRDCQTDNGQFPNIAPIGGGFGGIAWESAGIIIPMELFYQYGDRRVLEENYDSMKAYIGYLKTCGWPGLLNVGPLGDWLATDMSTDTHLLWNAIFYYDIRLVKEAAVMLGKTADAEELAALQNDVKVHWNETFVDAESGKTLKTDGTINDTQTSYALPLSLDVFSQNNIARAREHLVRRTEEVGYTITTGFLGTGPINPVLSDAGHSDVAYKLMRQTNYPSWLYTVTQGATTIWERWNSYTVENGFGGNNAMNSFNHYSLGAVGAWLYGYVLGIKRDENFPGFKRFKLEPAIESLDYAKGFFDSPYGRIESSWKVEAATITYEVSIPANTTASITLPAGDILESGKTLEMCNGIEIVLKDNNSTKLNALSGNYTFTIVL